MGTVNSSVVLQDSESVLEYRSCLISLVIILAVFEARRLATILQIRAASAHKSIIPPNKNISGMLSVGAISLSIFESSDGKNSSAIEPMNLIIKVTVIIGIIGLT